MSYKSSMTKEELLEVAADNGIDIAEGATKKEIISALENGCVGEDEKNDPTENADNTNVNEQEAQNSAKTQNTDNSLENKKETEETADSKAEEYSLYAYVGPTIPKGKVCHGMMFNGKLEKIKKYLSAEIEKYPQIEKLIVPANQLPDYANKVKTPGNIAHKHYHDIVSAMRGSKEV